MFGWIAGAMATKTAQQVSTRFYTITRQNKKRVPEKSEVTEVLQSQASSGTYASVASAYETSAVDVNDESIIDIKEASIIDITEASIFIMNEASTHNMNEASIHNVNQPSIDNMNDASDVDMIMADAIQNSISDIAESTDNMNGASAVDMNVAIVTDVIQNSISDIDESSSVARTNISADPVGTNHGTNVSADPVGTYETAGSSFLSNFNRRYGGTLPLIGQPSPFRVPINVGVATVNRTVNLTSKNGIPGSSNAASISTSDVMTVTSHNRPIMRIAGQVSLARTTSCTDSTSLARIVESPSTSRSFNLTRSSDQVSTSSAISAASGSTLANHAISSNRAEPSNSTKLSVAGKSTGKCILTIRSQVIRISFSMFPM